MSRALRPKKGDIYIKLQDARGSVAVLIPKANVTRQHTEAYEALCQVLSEQMIAKHVPEKAAVENP